jgi:cytochrome P450
MQKGCAALIGRDLAAFGGLATLPARQLPARQGRYSELGQPAAYGLSPTTNATVAPEETKIDMLLREDPPKHTRVRALMQQAFTPQRVAAMEPHTRDIARKLIDGIVAAGNECDFLRQFALPLPSTVMSGLLGVDSSMTETFARWANSMMGASAAHAIADEAARQKRYQEIASDAKDMEAFLKERIEERRASRHNRT